MNKAERLQRREVRPTTPGEILREDVMPALGISQGELATRLGVSRQTVNDLLTGKRPLSADIAHRLGRVLGNGPGLWLNMQLSVDMWDALHMDTRKYERLEVLEKAA
jgi:addiction module HigA family antidote